MTVLRTQPLAVRVPKLDAKLAKKVEAEATKKAKAAERDAAKDSTSSSAG